MPGFGVGYSTITGYSNIVGAEQRAMRGAGMQYPMQPGGPQVVNSPGHLFRAFPLGFFKAAIAKSGDDTVSEKPQLTFRGERLILPASVDAAANPFRITSLQVGQRNQFVSATSLFAESFFRQSVGVALELDTATIGQDITMGVRNTDAGATHDFRAVIIGTCDLPG